MERPYGKRKLSDIFKSQDGVFVETNTFLEPRIIHDEETPFTRDESMMKIRYKTVYDSKKKCYYPVTVINDKIV